MEVAPRSPGSTLDAMACCYCRGLGAFGAAPMASRSSKQSQSKDAEKKPLSFAERFGAIHKASQESESDRHSVAMANTDGEKPKGVRNGKKDKKKQNSNASSTSESDSLFDSSSDDSDSARSSPQPRLL